MPTNDGKSRPDHLAPIREIHLARDLRPDISTHQNGVDQDKTGC